MPLISEDVLVLQAFPYSETSKILRLLTRGHGVLSVIVKGARRPKSRYGGLLEPFTEGTATIYLKESRDLQTLSGFDLVRSGQALGSNLVRFGGASVIAELVLLAGSAEPDPLLHARVRDALRAIAAAPPPALEVLLLSRIWSLVAHLGFAPALDRCQACDRGLEEGDVAYFDYAAGGVRCATCGSAMGAGRSLPPEARSAVASLCAGELPALERTAAHWALLDRFLAYHVLEGRTLRSLEFLAGALSDEAGAQPAAAGP